MKFHDLELAVSRPRPPQHPLRLGDGRRDVSKLISAGTVGAPGVFIVPLQHEFGWTTAEISSALSIRFILFGLMAPFALLNRYGLRNVTLSALLVVASGLLMSLATTKVWQLMLLWGVGIGTGMTALVLGATIAARWFAARRGLVVGILTASVATGQLVFLPLLASLTERLGLADRAGTDLRDARRCDIGDARSSQRSGLAAVRR